MGHLPAMLCDVYLAEASVRHGASGRIATDRWDARCTSTGRLNLSDLFMSVRSLGFYGGGMTEYPAPVLDAIGIVADDLAASTDFYRRLGMSIPALNGPHAEAELSDGMRLMWDSAELAEKLDPERTPPSGGARVAFAFRCASPKAVDELYSDMDAAGFGHTAPYDAPWGQRYASLRDPDGNPVDLYCAQ